MKRRVCQHGGCGTVLSRYNGGSRCALHEKEIMSAKFTGNINGAYRLSRAEKRRLQREGGAY